MFTSVDGVRLHAAIEGSGLACLVPSATGLPLYQRTLSAQLRQHLQLVFLDLRGSGSSDAGERAAITLDRMLADLDAVRRDLGVEQVAVFGHSALGWLALAYAHAYPAHTARVIVVGTPPNLGERYRQLRAEYWETMASAERKDHLARNRAALDRTALQALPPHAAFIADYVARGPERFADPAFDWAFFWEGCTFDLGVTSRILRLFADPYDPTPTFATLSCPVFLAMGIHDYPLPPLSWAGELEKLPNLTYHVFEHSGHWPFYEEQARFDQRLVAWLQVGSLAAEERASA